MPAWWNGRPGVFKKRCLTGVQVRILSPALAVNGSASRLAGEQPSTPKNGERHVVPPGPFGWGAGLTV